MAGSHWCLMANHPVYYLLLWCLYIVLEWVCIRLQQLVYIIWSKTVYYNILLLLLWQSHVCSSTVAYAAHTYIFIIILYYTTRVGFPPAGPSPGGGERGQWLRARDRVVPTIICYYFLRDRPTACSRTPSERRQLRRRRRSGRCDCSSQYGSSAGATLEPVWPNLQVPAVPAVVSKYYPFSGFKTPCSLFRATKTWRIYV